MKKLIFSITAMFAVLVSGMAQDETLAKEKTTAGRGGYLIAGGGLAFPVGDFTSGSAENNHAGYAKIGYNLDLQAGYRLSKNFGAAASAFYSQYDFDNDALNMTDLSADRWEYYGIVAGPMYDRPLSENAFLNVTLMAGIANVRSPEFVSEGKTTLPAKWATGIPVKTSIGFREQMTTHSCIYAGLNYLYMEPKFKVTAEDGTLYEYHQKMTSIGLNIGIGIRF